jgi:hypothetical protein
MLRSLISAIIIAAALLGANAAPYDPDKQNVQALYNVCKAPESSQLYAVCLGYISGVADTMQLLGAAQERHPEFKPVAICATPSYGAMVQGFVNWAEANPKEWDENRIVGVGGALKKNWGCN